MNLSRRRLLSFMPAVAVVPITGLMWDEELIWRARYYGEDFIDPLNGNRVAWDKHATWSAGFKSADGGTIVTISGGSYSGWTEYGYKNKIPAMGRIYDAMKKPDWLTKDMWLDAARKKMFSFDEWNTGRDPDELLAEMRKIKKRQLAGGCKPYNDWKDWNHEEYA